VAQRLPIDSLWTLLTAHPEVRRADRPSAECVRAGLFQQQWQTRRIISRTLARFSRSVAQSYGFALLPSIPAISRTLASYAPPVVTAFAPDSAAGCVSTNKFAVATG